jgi:MFS family permease
MTTVTTKVALPVATRRSRLGSDFSRIFAATTVSNLGDGIREAAFPLLAATMTRDPLLVAGVAAAGRAPWLLLTLVSGAIVDRVDRRTLMWRVDVFRAVVMAALAASVLSGAGSLPILYVCAFLLGTAETLFDNAAHAILPSVVGRENLERANGRLESAMMVSNDFAGPPVGALLFAFAVAVPLAADAASFALASILVFSVRSRPGAVVVLERRSLRSDIAEGVRWLRGNSVLRSLSLTAAAVNLLVHGTWAIFVLYSLQVVGTGRIGFGILISAFAVGGVIGGMFASRIALRGPGRAITTAILLAAGSELVMGLFPHGVVIAGMLILLGFAGALWNVVTTSLRQRLVPDRLLGRVNSAHRMLSWGSIPIGALLGGLVARSFGLRAPFLLAAVILAGLAVVTRGLAQRLVASAETGDPVIDLQNA